MYLKYCKEVLWVFLLHIRYAKKRAGEAPIDLIERFRNVLQTFSSDWDGLLGFELEEPVNTSEFLEYILFSGLIHYPSVESIDEPHALNAKCRALLLGRLLYAAPSTIQKRYPILDVIRALLR